MAQDKSKYASDIPDVEVEPLYCSRGMKCEQRNGSCQYYHFPDDINKYSVDEYSKYIDAEYNRIQKLEDEDITPSQSAPTGRWESAQKKVASTSSCSLAIRNVITSLYLNTVSMNDDQIIEALEYAVLEAKNIKNR